MKFTLEKSNVQYTGNVFWDTIQTIEAKNIKQALKQVKQAGIFTEESIYGEKSTHIGSTFGYKLRKAI
jgi:hypothetical protein